MVQTVLQCWLWKALLCAFCGTTSAEFTMGKCSASPACKKAFHSRPYWLELGHYQNRYNNSWKNNGNVNLTVKLNQTNTPTLPSAPIGNTNANNIIRMLMKRSITVVNHSKDFLIGLISVTVLHFI